MEKPTIVEVMLAHGRADSLSALTTLLGHQYQALEAGDPVVTQEHVIRTLTTLLELSGIQPETAKEVSAKAEADEFADLLNVYRNDITTFAKQVFNVDLTKEQAAFCEEWRTGRQITRTEAPAWGKTFCTAILTWWSLICFDDVLVTIVGPSEHGLKGGVWKEVQNLHDRMAVPFKDMFEVSAFVAFRKTRTSCFAEFRIATVATSRGIHAKNNFVFVDEADGVSEEIIRNLSNILVDPNPKLCILSLKPTAEQLKKLGVEPASVVFTMEQVRNEALHNIRFIANDPTSPVQYDAALYLLQYADARIRAKEEREFLKAFEAKTAAE